MGKNKEVEYLIEKILAKKRINNQVHYKIKWSGCSIANCTWEPITNLKAAYDLIFKFEKDFKLKNEIKGDKAIKSSDSRNSANFSSLDRKRKYEVYSNENSQIFKKIKDNSENCINIIEDNDNDEDEEIIFQNKKSRIGRKTKNSCEKNLIKDFNEVKLLFKMILLKKY